MTTILKELKRTLYGKIENLIQSRKDFDQLKNDCYVDLCRIRRASPITAELVETVRERVIATLDEANKYKDLTVSCVAESKMLFALVSHYCLHDKEHNDSKMAQEIQRKLDESAKVCYTEMEQFFNQFEFSLDQVKQFKQ